MGYETLIISTAVSFLALLVLIIFFIVKKRKNSLKSGIKGEKKVARRLKRFAGIRNFKVINDIYLPLYDKTTQIDHILITFYGIIVIETKNYKGEVYGNPADKNWIHIVGSERNQMYNPIMQNTAHIDCLRHILSKEKIYKINIDSIIVFTDNKVQLYLPKNLPVIKMKKLNSFLKQSKYKEDRDLDVDKIYNAIMKYKVTDKKLISEHSKNIKKIAEKNK